MARAADTEEATAAILAVIGDTAVRPGQILPTPSLVRRRSPTRLRRR